MPLVKIDKRFFVEIIPYSAQDQNNWDRFVHHSKNANFQHYRNYMGYHQERFTDNSLMFVQDKNIIALLPANVTHNMLISHLGISYGGLLLCKNVKQKEVLQMFESLLSYCAKNNLAEIIFKLQPFIYNTYPSEEVHYALYRFNGVLATRAVSSVIPFDDMLPYGKGRKWSIKKSLANNIIIKESNDFESFMEIEKNVLQSKYNTNPVHTHTEIANLQQLFPGNVQLFGVYHEEKLIGGTILFSMGPVLKCQYICSNDLCKELHGLDFLFDSLIKKYQTQFRYFDFGHSTQDGGRYLEDKLIQNKESYGARAVCYDSYTIKI